MFSLAGTFRAAQSDFLTAWIKKDCREGKASWNAKKYSRGRVDSVDEIIWRNAFWEFIKKQQTRRKIAIQLIFLQILLTQYDILNRPLITKSKHTKHIQYN